MYRPKICVVGHPFIKRGMVSLSVVEPDPVVDGAFDLEAGLEFMQIDGLLLEGSPQPFDEYIVEIPTSSVHGYFDLGVGQSGAPGRSHKLVTQSMVPIR